MTAWTFPPPAAGPRWTGYPDEAQRDGLHLILLQSEVHAPMWRAQRSRWEWGTFYNLYPYQMTQLGAWYIGPLTTFLRAVAVGTTSAYAVRQRDQIADGLGLDPGAGASEEDHRARGYGLRFAQLIRDIPAPLPEGIDRLTDRLVSELLPMLLESNAGRNQR